MACSPVTFTFTLGVYISYEGSLYKKCPLYGNNNIPVTTSSETRSHVDIQVRCNVVCVCVCVCVCVYIYIYIKAKGK